MIPSLPNQPQPCLKSASDVASSHALLRIPLDSFYVDLQRGKANLSRWQRYSRSNYCVQLDVLTIEDVEFLKLLTYNFLKSSSDEMSCELVCE